MSEHKPEPPAAPCSLPSDLAVRRFAHRAMACEWGLFIHGEEPEYAERVAQAAFAEIDRVEQEISRFVMSSDIARLNALPGGEKLKIGIEAFECLELAEQVRADTAGAFDVTFRGKEAAAGGPRLKLDRTTRSVSKSADGVVVDLGGIGKGYAIDQVMELLGRWSVRSALVHSGQSTLRAIGNAGDSRGWNVALRDPRDHDRTLRSVGLSSRALSGSGAALHGRHIIDPRTGKPASGPLAAWALAPSAALADALSTAFIVIGAPGAREYCKQHDEVTAVVLADRGDRGKLTVYGKL